MYSGLYLDVDKICIVVSFLFYLTLVKFGMICVTLLSYMILSVFFCHIRGHCVFFNKNSLKYIFSRFWFEFIKSLKPTY